MQNVIRECLPLLCKAVARLCLRHGLKLNDVVNAMKKALLEAAAEELERKGELASISRLSVMTGVHRPDATLIRKRGELVSRTVDTLTRILWKWGQDVRFQTKSGKPRTLSVEGRESHFAELVHSVSAALNHYTVLFELERSGHVCRTSRGVKLTQPEYQPAADPITNLAYLAQDMCDLATSVDENIFGKPDFTKNHHITTEYDAVPQAIADEVKQWLLSEGRKVHSRFRHYLASIDHGERKASEKYVRVLFSSFSLVEKDPITKGKLK